MCTASRAAVEGDLRAGGTRVTASAGGLAPTGAGVVATATTTAGVATVPPRAGDDEAYVPHSTPTVTVGTSGNDAPGEPDGPALDVSRTVLLERGAADDSVGRRGVSGNHGLFSVLEDGSVRYVPLTEPWFAAPISQYTETVRYRTFDRAGGSAIATVRITFRAGATARPDAVTGLQGDPVVARPLSNDSPGRAPDDSRATFDPTTFRLTADQPDGTAVVSPTGDTASIPWIGSFAIVDGTLTFEPSPTFAWTVGVAYSVTDSTGSTVRSVVTFSVTPVVPTVTNDATSTVFGRSTTLAGATNDTAGAPGRAVRFDGFVDRGGAGAGEQLFTPQGVWWCPLDVPGERVRFEPAAGFSGVATARYTARSERGGTAVAGLSVVVRPGASAPPSLVKTPRDTAVTVDPTRGATASQHADGSPGHFVVRRTTFEVPGQADGAVVSENGTVLDLPGRGTARIAAGTGLVTFDPASGFTGSAGRIRYGLENDDSGFENSIGSRVLSTLALLVTSDAPVASDDRATTDRTSRWRSPARPTTTPAPPRPR